MSVGRGTDRPFQQLGAPWLDSGALVKALTRHGLPGVRFESVRFTPVAPDDGKYGGIEVHGVRLVTTDRSLYDPTVTAVAVLSEMRRQAGDHWEWRESSFDRLAGTDRLRRAIEAGANGLLLRRSDLDLDVALERTEVVARQHPFEEKAGPGARERVEVGHVSIPVKRHGGEHAPAKVGGAPRHAGDERPDVAIVAAFDLAEDGVALGPLFMEEREEEVVAVAGAVPWCAVRLAEEAPGATEVLGGGKEPRAPIDGPPISTSTIQDRPV